LGGGGGGGAGQLGKEGILKSKERKN
jgi:hypothetical protein